MLLLSEPTGNDPNSWIVWATQLALGHGVDFSVGPSWKPLPVLASLPPALVSSSLAAFAWVWLIRFAALTTSVLLYRLVGRYWGVAGGVTAALTPFLIQPWVKSAVIGMSEPVLLALMLGAACAAIEGKDRLAVVLASGAGLVRPEVWPLVLIWFGWKWRSGSITGSRAAGLTAGVVGIWGVSWFGIPLALGAALDQGTSRAAAALDLGASGTGLLGIWLKDIPSLAWPLIPIGVIAAVVCRRQPKGKFTLVCCAAVLGWLFETWALNAAGILPGIARYALPAGIIGCAVAGSGAGWVAEWLSRVKLTWLTPASAATLVAVAAVVVTIGGGVEMNRTTWNEAIIYRDSAAEEWAALRKAGGVGGLAGCLPFATSGYPSHARMLARNSDQPLQAFTADPQSPDRAIVLQSSNPGVGSQPRLPRTKAIALSKIGSWTVIYYGPKSGCSG